MERTVDIERLSWIIQVAQSNHTGPYKWMTFPSDGQRGRCNFGKKAQKDAKFLALKVEERGEEPKNVAAAGSWKGQGNSLLLNLHKVAQHCPHLDQAQ